MNRLAAVWFVVVFAWSSGALAQDAPPRAPGGSAVTAPAQETDVAARFQAGWSRVDLENQRIFAAGNVQIRWAGFRLRCRAAVIWGRPADEDGGSDPGESSIRISEIYAEGDVVLVHGEVLRSFESGSIYMDLVHHRAVHFNVTQTVHIDSRTGPISIVMRAEEGRQIGRDRYELLDLWVTASPFENPTLRLDSDGMRIQVDPPAQKPDGRPGETVRNVHYEIDPSIFSVGDVPLLPVPTLTGNTAQRLGLGLVRSVGVDQSGKFGTTAFLSLGDSIDVEDRPWGDWTVHTRYLGDRGPGLGLDLEYRTDDYRGMFQGFYQNDRGEDQIFPGPDEQDRGRATWRHRHQLPESIQLDVEFSKISDRGYLPEYEETEFKSEKEQETIVYLKRALENRAATLLFTTRLNEFQDQVEHQPRLGYALFSEPLLELGDVGTLYLDTDWELSRARRRFDDATDLPDQDAFRADFDQTIGLPLFAGPLKIEPFAGLRYTYYSNRRVSGRGIDRVSTLYGVRAATEFHRSFDVAGGLFDLDGLRHIVTPEVEYLAVGHVSHDPTDFIQFDSIDAQTEFEVVRFGLRNRLQTVWTIDDVPEVVDFVDLDVEWPWYFQADRDNFGEQAGNIDVDLALRFSPRFILLTDFEYSFRLDTFEIFNTTLGFVPNREFQLALGYRRYAGVNDVVFAQTQWHVSDRLDLIVQSGYDFVENQIQDQSLTLRRIGEEWVFEFEISYDNSGDFGFGISILPRGLFDPRFRGRPLRSEPRFADFGGNLLRH